MTTTVNIAIIVTIALLSVAVALLLWRNMRDQRELRDKDEAIIREIRENQQLRDELREVLLEK